MSATKSKPIGVKARWQSVHESTRAEAGHRGACMEAPEPERGIEERA